MSLLTTRRLNRIALAVLFAILLSILLDSAYPRPDASIIERGDFPGLYVQAEMLRRGQGGALYDPAVQRNIENELWPSLDGRFLMSVYPPTVGVALLPLTFVPLPVAQHLYLLMNALAFYIGVLVASRAVERSGAFPRAIALLCFAPSFYGVLGGQNTGFSMLCLGGILYCVSRLPSRRHEVLLGLAAGCWMFKPQFGLYAMLLLLCLRAHRAILMAGMVSVGHYLIGALAVGPQWPLQLIEAVRVFSPLNFQINIAQQTSLVGFVKAFGAGWASVVAAAAALGVLGLLIRKARRAQEREERIHVSLLWFASLSLLVPQALFYDLALPAAMLAVSLQVRNWRQLATLILGLAISWGMVIARASVPVPWMIFWSMSIPLLVTRYRHLAIVNERRKMECP